MEKVDCPFRMKFKDNHYLKNYVPPFGPLDI